MRSLTKLIFGIAVFVAFLLMILFTFNIITFPRFESVTLLTKIGDNVYKTDTEDIYEGEIKNGLFSGKGTLVLNTGTKYIGDFERGLFSGKGELKSNDGWEYSGEFKNGLPDGKGEFHLTNNDVYKGSFIEGMMNGQGVYTTAKGEKFEGNFINNSFDNLNSKKLKNLPYSVELKKGKINIEISLSKTKEKEATINSSITIIGDSVLEGANYNGSFNNMKNTDIYAETSRSLNSGTIELVENLKANNSLGKTVVLALATNGIYSKENLNKMLSVIGNERKIILVTGHTGGSEMAPINELIRNTAKKYSHIFVADWDKYLEDHKVALEADRTHVWGKAADQYASVIKEAVKNTTSPENTSIVFPFRNLNIEADTSLVIPYYVSSALNDVKKISFRSLNDYIATIVDENMINAVQVGTTRIEGKVGEYTKAFTLNVLNVDFNDLGLSKEQAIFISNVGKYPLINTYIKGRKSVLSIPKFRSKDTKICSVNEAGVVIPRKIGTTKIEVSLERALDTINIKVVK